MPTFTAITTLAGQDQAEALGAALENLVPEPIGVGVYEIEDGSGLREVACYFVEPPDDLGLALLAKAQSMTSETTSTRTPFTVEEVVAEALVAPAEAITATRRVLTVGRLPTTEARTRKTRSESSSSMISFARLLESSR